MRDESLAEEGGLGYVKALVWSYVGSAGKSYLYVQFMVHWLFVGTQSVNPSQHVILALWFEPLKIYLGIKHKALVIDGMIFHSTAAMWTLSILPSLYIA